MKFISMGNKERKVFYVYIYIYTHMCVRAHIHTHKPEPCVLRITEEMICLLLFEKNK